MAVFSDQYLKDLLNEIEKGSNVLTNIQEIAAMEIPLHVALNWNVEDVLRRCACHGAATAAVAPIELALGKIELKKKAELKKQEARVKKNERARQRYHAKAEEKKRANPNVCEQEDAKDKKEVSCENGRSDARSKKAAATKKKHTKLYLQAKKLRMTINALN